jgi:hypothetical protein
MPMFACVHVAVWSLTRRTAVCQTSRSGRGPDTHFRIPQGVELGYGDSVGGFPSALPALRSQRCRREPPAGVWGVPRSFILPPRVGARGLTQLNGKTVQRNAAGSLRVSLSHSLFHPPRSKIRLRRNGGSRGLNMGIEGFPRPRRSVALRGATWIPAPRLHEDKLRGNDKWRRLGDQ